ncbi:MAG: hypothetical protein M1812_001593 [Candelaria pacifica]|nr:MAG: hypothetical protein M1812_001593 [Candelaria pacifica]
MAAELVGKLKLDSQTKRSKAEDPKNHAGDSSQNKAVGKESTEEYEFDEDGDIKTDLLKGEFEPPKTKGFKGKISKEVDWNKVGLKTGGKGDPEHHDSDVDQTNDGQRRS